MHGDFQIGDWLVQPLRDRIESSASSVQIEPKAMDLLVYLARHADRVVTKDQLISEVWEGAFVTEEVLTNSIYKLRQALGDDPKDPRFIQTVPRRGYQLIASVEFQQPDEESVDRYRKMKKIGQGAMGEVYLVEDLLLNRQVALKFPLEEQEEDDTSRRRLVREARAAAALDHPFICKVYDTGILEGRTFIAMEYLSGELLKERLARGLPSLDEAVRIAVETTEALEASHGKGIVHRDIKPSNMMLTGQGHVKVMDFGVAKKLAAAEEDAQDFTKTLTRDESTLGTLPYMSPEQVRGQAVDTRSDIFSLGAVLYEMLTRVHPFRKRVSADTAAAILSEDPPPPSQLREDLPIRLESVVKKMLAKEPDRRYQSVREIRNELIGLLEERGRTLTVPLTPKKKPPLSGIWTGLSVLAAILLVSLVVWNWDVLRPPLSEGDRRSIAVLPFENLSAERDNEYFSDGVTGQIISHLAKIRDLKVISRTSIMQYKETNKNLPQIGAELGVSTILEGTVQRDSERVLITAQLFDTSRGDNLWADTYDRELADIFAVQSDVALQIAEALETNLTPGEKEDIEERPTENIEAYNYYLRALSYNERSERKRDLMLAIQMLEEAIKLDPNFALAYAALSEHHSMMYWFFYDRTTERIATAKAGVDQALQLKPDLPEAHRALGNYYYRCYLDYDRALDELDIARAGRPNDSEVFAGIGYVRRRQGRFEEAAANLRRALELDPRGAQISSNLAETYLLMRRWDEAEELCDRAISLTPEDVRGYGLKAYLYLRSEGNVDKARAVLKTARELGLEWEEDARTADIAVSSEVYHGNYQEALEQVSSRWPALDDQFYYIPKELLEASVYGLLDQTQSEQAQYESARKILEAKVQENPEDSRLRSSLGIAYAGLDRKEDAIREGELGTELMPISKEAWKGAYRVEDLGRIYLMVGEYDAAIEQLDLLLSIPSRITVPLLRIDPVWAPLHDQPKFKELVERHRR